MIYFTAYFRKNKFYFPAILWFLFVIPLGHTFAQKDTRFPPSDFPDRINLSVTENPSTSIAVTWRTSTDIQQGMAEIIEASADPRKYSEPVSLPAKTELLITEKGEYKTFTWDEVKANYHSVVFADLTPNTLYNYRVGSDNAFSEWFQFKTASDKAERFSFLYFGDAQTGIHSMWSKVIRKAYAHAPEAKLMLHAGDLINRAVREAEWGEWFEAGSFIHATIPGMPSTGNHEYSGMTLSPNWRPQFTLPQNGPEGLEETSYFTDIQGVRFISLNSYLAEESVVHRESQQKWLGDILKNNPHKWTVVVFHHPVFSAKSSRENLHVRKRFKPLFDQYKVDLVLQGHDHTYARGMEKIPMDKVEETSGTMYVISVSGPKMTGSKVETKDWMDVDTIYTQLYQVITIDGDKLVYDSYTSNGELMDGFDLIKQPGRINKIINRVAIK